MILRFSDQNFINESYRKMSAQYHWLSTTTACRLLLLFDLKIVVMNNFFGSVSSPNKVVIFFKPSPYQKGHQILPISDSTY